MFIHWTTDGRAWLVTDDSWVHITTPAHVAILRRMLNPEKEDTFTPDEVEMMKAYMAQARSTAIDILRKDMDWLNQGSPDSLKAIHQSVKAKPAVAVDNAAIAKSVIEQIAKQGVSVDPKAIAAAVDAALIDNFAAIPGAVNDDAAKRMGA